MATKPFLEKNLFQAGFAFKYIVSERYTQTLILKVVTITLVLGFTYNVILFLIMLLKKNYLKLFFSATETCKIIFPLFLFLETIYV